METQDSATAARPLDSTIGARLLYLTTTAWAPGTSYLEVLRSKLPGRGTGSQRSRAGRTRTGQTAAQTRRTQSRPELLRGD